MDKTQEQKREEKAERFKANPDSFIEINEIVIACIKTEQGISVYTSPCKRSTLGSAKTELDHAVHKHLTRMDFEADMAGKDKKIIKPNFRSNLKGFLRR